MKKIIPIILLFLLFIPAVFADGMMHIYDNDMWSLLTEEQQFCAINYKNGYQHMILTVDTGQELKGDKAVWIFPVPAQPEKVAINIIKGFPNLMGYDIEEKADQLISEVFSTMRATQVYAFPLMLFAGQFGATSEFGKAGDSLGGVTVHERIEKMGLTTELVSAENGILLANYVASKGLDLPDTSKYILQGYTGQKYSFVISWISDVEKFKQEQRAKEISYRGMWTGNALGVFISFPTEKIYYPLMPTSVYGSKRVPAVIYVLDYVTPELYDGIKSDTEVNYFYQIGSTYSEELRDFFVGYEKNPMMLYSELGETPGFAIDNIKYTKIKVNPPSKYLTQDLWIDSSAPFKIKSIDFINQSGFIFALIFFIICSCLASMISGMISFRGSGASKLKFALFGLFNFLTLIGFSLAAYLGRIDIRFTESKEIQENNASFKKIAIITALIGLISPLCMALLSASSFRYLDFEIIGILLTVYAITCALIAPFIWGLYNNREIMKFTILFTILFIILTILFQLFLSWMI